MELKLAVLAAVGLLVAVWFLKPRWFKMALLGAGVLVGVGAAASYMSKIRRLRQIGLADDEARRIATIVGDAERIRRSADAVENIAAADAVLKAKQRELEEELRRLAGKKEISVDEVRDEIRLHWPDF